MKFLLPLFLLLLPLSVFALSDYEDDDFLFTDNEGITVTGTIQTSQQIAIIDREQIEHSGAADIAYLLQDSLGLNVIRHGAYGNNVSINLRGFDTKRVAVLINGMPVNSSLDGKFDISQIDMNSIERIEVIYGGADSKYNVSGAFGGVINIITIKKQEPGLRLAASVSNTSAMPGRYRDRNGEMQEPHREDLFDTQNYSLSAAYGAEALSLTTKVFANRADNHFIFLDYTDRPRRKDNNEVRDAGASAALVWELRDLSRILLSSGFYYGNRNFPSSGFSGNAGNQRDLAIRENIIFDMPRAFRDDMATEFSAGYQFHRREYTAPNGMVSLHDQLSISAVNRWNWFSGGSFTLRGGADYSYTHLDSTDAGKRSRFDSGFYMTAEIKPAESFLVIPSSKIIFTSEGSGNFALIPKLGILWNVTENFALKNNYFRNFKFPDFEELYWGGGGGIGNPNLRPEDGWGADLGGTWRVTKLLQLESVFFAQWIRDSIHWFSGSGGIWRPENAGEAALFGLENKAVFGMPFSGGPFNKVTATFSHRYLLSYLLSYNYTFTSNKRIPYNPEHILSGSLELGWKNGALTVSGHYESLRFHDIANHTALKPHFLLNASVNQKTGKNLTVFCALRNILNTSYESFFDYPMPGTTLTLGIRAAMEVK
ncbi:MAG: TonB-dependent receptor [Treponema sp.]|nr:TonB-dependent receptor [Treponema sp.]